VGKRRYVLRKLVQAFITLIAILIFNFFLFRVWSPGDPVSFLTRGQGANISPEERQDLIEEYGLDKSTTGQFVEYVKDTATLKLGASSFYQGEPVMEVFLRFLWPTLLLVGLSTLFSMIIGIWLGIRSGWRRGSAFDRTSMIGSLVLYSMPEFWLGMLLLLLFSSTLEWFPVGGRISTNASDLSGVGYALDVANHLFLPVLTLTLAYIGQFYLVMRSSLLDVLGEDYITTARAKGLTERTVIYGHALKNSLISLITVLGTNIGALVSGLVVTEQIFAWPGLGWQMVTSIAMRDYQVVQGAVLYTALMFVTINLLVDVCYALLDPRIHYE